MSRPHDHPRTDPEPDPDPQTILALRQAFEEALARPPAERAGFASKVFADDPELRERLLALLRSDEGTGVLDRPPGIVPPTPSHWGPAPGTVIGPYRLLSVLGEGGFAVVLLAEQTSPVQRRVALKVLRPEMMGGNVLLRFELERHALQRMEHPSITRVYDAGEFQAPDLHGTRLPYLVMELVEGEPITSYCRERALSQRRRLEMFTQVCGAVQHAHQRGVIHRDLKPSNVLVATVDGCAVPKVIDFGVAKLLEDSASPHGPVTREGSLLGTPEYMSPEQASLSPGLADTRTDVYALGVLLFEMLTGKTPHDVEGRSYGEALRIIREESPRRLCDASTFLRGDLRVIVEQALHKEPDRRYGSAAELGADVRRYLGDLPILARRPSVAYQLSRLVRRHRGMAAAGTLAIASLGAGGSLAGFHWARSSLEASRQRQVVAFMGQVLGIAQPYPDDLPGSGSEVLARAVELLEATPGLDPNVQAGALTAVARALTVIDRRGEALVHLRTVLRLREATAGARDPATLEAMCALGNALLQEGDYRRGMGKGGDIQRLLDEGAELIQEYTGRVLDVHGRSSREWVFALDMLGLSLAQVGRREEALAILDEAAALVPDPSWEDGVRAPHVGFHRAYVLSSMGEWEEARDAYERLLPIHRAANGLRHPACMAALMCYAGTLRSLDDVEASIAAYREYVELSLMGTDSVRPHVLNTINSLGVLQYRNGQFLDAEGTLRTAVRLRRRILGDEHPDTLVSLNNLAALLVDAKRPIEALAVSAELSRSALAAGPELERRYRGMYLRRHARVLRALELDSEALPWLERAYGEVSDPEVVDARIAAVIALDLAEVLGELGRSSEAAAWSERAATH